MIPLTTLYDKYIDRSKLTEEKPFEYIVPPPSRGSEQKMRIFPAIRFSIQNYALRGYMVF